MIALSGVSQICAQEEDKISLKESEEILLDFLNGRWGGHIKGSIRVTEEGTRGTSHFKIQFLGVNGQARVELDGTWNVKTDDAILNIRNFRGVYACTSANARCSFDFKYGNPLFIIDIGDCHGTGMDQLTFPIIQCLKLGMVKADKMNKNIIHLNHWDNPAIKAEAQSIPIGIEYDLTGELRKMCDVKDNVSLDVILSTKYTNKTETLPNRTQITKSNDRVKIVTKDGCVELYLKDYFKITGSDGTEMEMSISKVLDGVISSELYQGSVQVDIWEGGKHHHFFTRNAIVEVSGTNFTMEVSKDGTTTLTVLNGEVEFSDIKKKGTVIVKKNQRSVVKPGGLPTEPKAIEQNQIPRWWE